MALQDSLLPVREYKDRLFKKIFGDTTEESKRWRLDLYNALNGKRKGLRVDGESDKHRRESQRGLAEKVQGVV